MWLLLAVFLWFVVPNGFFLYWLCFEGAWAPCGRTGRRWASCSTSPWTIEEPHDRTHPS